jgi:hypothetical protein
MAWSPEATVPVLPTVLADGFGEIDDVEQADRAKPNGMASSNATLPFIEPGV